MQLADKKPKKIACPRCLGHMTLDDFEVIEHEDETWTAETSIECPHDCGANFFITRSKVEWVKGN
jgi:hypothetical protein